MTYNGGKTVFQGRHTNRRYFYLDVLVIWDSKPGKDLSPQELYVCVEITDRCFRRKCLMMFLRIFFVIMMNIKYSMKFRMAINNSPASTAQYLYGRAGVGLETEN